VPANVREFVEADSAAQLEDEAIEAIGHLNELISHWGWADIPKLDEATSYALRAVGGLRAYAFAEEREMRFLRKDFLAAYRRYRERCHRELERSAAPELMDALKSLAASKAIQ
jgi:hypothetical protein